MGGEWEPFYGGEDEYMMGDLYGDEYGDEEDEQYGLHQLMMYQDGIFEDDISENARHYPRMGAGAHRGNRRRRVRKSQHRYPHVTH